MPARAFITGCAEPTLREAERRFFRDAEPWGLILFRRNLVDAQQIRRLAADFRDLVGRPDAPVLIDQEGGRVQRLKLPLAPDYPAAGAIGEIYRLDAEDGLRAAWLVARLIAEDLYQLGITVDCLPVLDLRHEGAHDIVGDRAYSGDPEVVARLAGAAARGLSAGGVAPVAKHIPGHGRALADSHEQLPAVSAPLDELSRSDFVPFRIMAHLPMAMTAHVLYSDIDDGRPATLSPRAVHDIIRTEIGFGGLLMTDDLSMGALSGSVGERAAAGLAAGCDIALHCNGDLAEMEEVAGAAPELSGEAASRAAAALGWARREESDIEAARDEFADLLSTIPCRGTV